MGMGRDFKVWAFLGRVQKCACAGTAKAILGGLVEVACAFLVFAIVILGARDAHFLCSADECFGNFAFRAYARYRQTTATSMDIAFAILMDFRPLEEGQNVIVAPTFVA